ncbi:MAG: DEAD/DEAH box helicase [candidate division KSB1 bacterium]|nr:DEAD/DEAH box helicase [candidate division KSB1 bacterium]
MKNISAYIAKDVCLRMAEEIRAAGGNEVFFLGYLDDDLIVHDVVPTARGNEAAVPAVMQAAREADVVIHNHPSGPLTPSDADLSIAARLADFSVAFYIVNNRVDDLYVVVEPFAPTECKPLEAEAITALLAPNGPIAKQLPDYEIRPQQAEMIRAVIRAFNENLALAVEAGTGTGKTLAYLLPAIYWAKQNKERVVISTNTINLQEQLIKKDIPLLQKTLPVEFEAVLVKGRSNYVCLRKVDEIAGELDLGLEDDEYEELQDLIRWARASQDGSKADLTYIPSNDVWERIAAEGDACTHAKCLHFRDCFVNKARRRAGRADILVVNHHLLFADLAIRRQTGSFQDAAVLPPYQRIIFDEAHHIEDVATNYFGSQVTRAGLQRILHRLHHRKKNLEKGFLHTLRSRVLKHHNELPPALSESLVTTVRDKLAPNADSLLESMHFAMDRLFETVFAHTPEEGDNERKIRLLPQTVDSLFVETGLADLFRDLMQSLRLYAVDLLRFCEEAKKLRAFVQEDWEALTIDIEAQAERLAAAADILQQILFQESETEIRWIETAPRKVGRPIVRLQISPLEVKSIMKEAVFEAYKTVVMTSATLTVEQSFAFWAQRIGFSALPNSRRSELLLPSPFDFERQVLLCVPTDMPDPRDSGFAEALSKAVFKAVSITQGRAFILFTSYSLLNQTYRRLKESLELIGIQALKQGDLNRHELLRQFRQDKTSVLFGTDSFWEGVDVQGDALENVIITRLPFQVPSEPIIQARYEAIEAAGGNAFMDYAVPLAVLKFKQGFGRLIRHKNDRGCVISFDKRIVEKTYGTRFLNSLPQCRTVIGPSELVFAELKLFFNN